MKVYIDDMLVKSTTAELHIAHLSEAFQILREYNMKLNPAKYAFGVSAGKFLGFIVNNRGIEANPDKIKVVLDIPPPSGIKEDQRLTGRIAALSLFVEPSIDLYEEEVAPIESKPSWRDLIWDYLIDGRLPDDPKKASKIRTRSARFTNHRGSLYKRGFFTPILKCIAGKDTDYVLREVHEGVCRNHIGARTLAGKVLRHGYY